MIAGLVSHYRVVTTVGEGGMGVVYKAIDTRLNRPVAIKALRGAGDIEADAVIRLRAEALAAASLDHPYICKIYELLDGEAGPLIVMEFVEGETLAQRLSTGVPPLADTLKYGSEIAEGLANAHAHGLVHRDIKPSNVMITAHGHVKLLDFGVAHMNRLGSGETTTHRALTRPGAAAGTPIYMAPEQALGQAVDARADLFSLGVVLFECLTRQLPFEGTTRDAYVQAMLAGRRRSLETLAPSVPPGVRQLVDQCLEEDPRRRPASADALATELRSAAEALGTGASARGGAAAWVRSAWITRGLLAALALGSITGAALVWRSVRNPAPPPGLSMAAAVTDPGADTDPRISPDGRWLSFLSDREGSVRVFVQAMEAGNPRAIDLPADGVISHTWSPDGRALACVAWQKDVLVLLVVPAFFGGVPLASIALTPRPEDVRLSRWTSAGIFADVDLSAAGHRLWRMAADGSGIDDLTRNWRTGLKYRSFDISPDGTQAVLAASNEGHDDLWLAAPDGSRLRRLTNDAFVERNPVWTTPHTVAFQSNRSGQLDLWEIEVASGRVAQLTSSQTVESPGASAADGSLLAYEQVGQNATLWRLGSRVPAAALTGDALSDFSPSTSADGRQIAFQRTRPTLPEGYPFLDSRIIVARVGDSGQLGAQAAVGDGFAPRTSPDGAWVAYLQRGPEPARFALQARNLETGQTRLVSAKVPLVSMSFGFPMDWAEQKVTWAGPLLVFVEALQDGQRIAGLDLSRDAQVRTVVPASEWQVQDVRVSPDNLRLAYLRWRAGIFELRVRDLASATEEVVHRASGRAPRVLLRGWTTGGSVIVLHAAANPDGTDRLGIEEEGPGVPHREVAVIERAFGATARLDPPGTRLYVTRADGGVHNIWEVVLANGRIRRLTDNQQRGVSFSGIQPLPDGGLMYSRSEWRRDIWLARRHTLTEREAQR